MTDGGDDEESKDWYQRIQQINPSTEPKVKSHFDGMKKKNIKG